MTIKISVVVITFNEQKNIGRCLESVKGIADDVVVVDSYSDDGTEKICREHGFFHRQKCLRRWELWKKGKKRIILL